MRTNIVIDDALMDEALRATGARTKREVVELGLRTLVQLRAQARIRSLRGKLAATWPVPGRDALLDALLPEDDVAAEFYGDAPALR